MKINIKRTMKYITSFMGIVLALMLCVTPAFAAEDGIYVPADYLNGSPIVDAHGVITYHYNFKTTPLIRSYFTDVFDQDFYSHDATLHPPEGTMKTAFRVFPLGVYGNTNQPWPTNRGVIDVRDFKAYSQFELAATFDVLMTFVYPVNGTITLRWYWFVQCYDSSGWPTGLIRSTTYDKNFDITNAGTTGTSVTAGGVLQLPENTSYILPSCYIVLNSPPLSESSYYNVSAYDLNMSFSIDSVLENTLTMQTMKDQLGDISSGIGNLGDKLDDIFNGTPEQNQQAGETVDRFEEHEKDFDSILDQLNDYEHLDISWSGSVLANFVASNAYLYFKDLFSPILNWTPYVNNLLAVLAFVNLSVILFGR